MIKEDLIYLAGFFDGEGYIIICRDKTKVGNISYRLRIGASQVVPEPIDLLKAHFGGLIQKHKPQSDKHRSTYTWQQHSQKAANALRELLPYLRVKKDQAEFALDWLDKNSKFRGRKKTEEDILWCEAQKDILSSMKGYLR